MFRLGTRFFLGAVLLLCAQFAFSQTRRAPGMDRPTELTVHVTWPNERSAPMHLRVDLISGRGFVSIAQAFTDSEGRATFRVTETGSFRVKVTGGDIEETVSDPFNIDRLEGVHHEYVQVKPRAEATPNSPGGMISAGELKISDAANKEFKKGVDASAGRNWAAAIKHFEKAVAEYPQFDVAYNNLGVAYINSGDTQHAHEAFDKAISLNPRNANAYRNLSRLYIRDKKFGEAMAAVNKSLEAEPRNAESMVLVAMVYLSAERWNDALLSARKVHEVPHQSWAIAHVIAARALEQMNQQQQAAAEYRTYLKESPNSANAEQVKEALARLDRK